MQFVECPFCGANVVPTAEGNCPSCRKAISAPEVAPKGSVPCPSCGKTMSPGAVLCIACGYHTKLGGQLATVLDEEAPRAIDSNPYAAPAGVDGSSPRAKGAGPYNDLTELGARRAEAVVRDAEMVWKVLLFSLCGCGLAWPFIFPWFGFRLASWYSLNSDPKDSALAGAKRSIFDRNYLNLASAFARMPSSPTPPIRLTPRATEVRRGTHDLSILRTAERQRHSPSRGSRRALEADS